MVRNPELWFSVFPGRHGDRYSSYRLPQSLLGTAAIVFSDATGPRRDARRHFFYVLVSAAAAGALAGVYWLWFRRRTATARAAVLWALGGVFCTPCWYYGTSTFDDILGALALVAAVVYASRIGIRKGRGVAFASGFLFGVAYNVKQPLAAFALIGLAAVDRPSDARSDRVIRAALLVLGVAAGIAIDVAYGFYKFPPESRGQHAELLSRYLHPFPGHPLWGLAVLTLSPSAGFVWYCPAILLGIEGLRRCWRQSPGLGWAMVASSAVFVCFIGSMSFAKGDPAWGPRYLTPLYALLWLFAPEGAARLRPIDTRTLLALGSAVQLLALTADPDRLHIDRGLPGSFGALFPVLYFDARNANLFARPREIVDMWQARDEHGERFSWVDPPTAGPEPIDRDRLGTNGVARFKVLNAFRPWWVSHRYIDRRERPVSLLSAALWFAALLAGGVVSLVGGLRAIALSRRPAAVRSRGPGGVRGDAPD